MDSEPLPPEDAAARPPLDVTCRVCGEQFPSAFPECPRCRTPVKGPCYGNDRQWHRELGLAFGLGIVSIGISVLAIRQLIGDQQSLSFPVMIGIVAVITIMHVFPLVFMWRNAQSLGRNGRKDQLEIVHDFWQAQGMAILFAVTAGWLVLSLYELAFVRCFFSIGR